MRLASFLLQLAACGLLLSLNSSWAADESSALGIKAPEGFEVSLFAGDDLAHDIYSMTIDSHGRVVVAGAGYVKILHDDNKDGKADRATLFSSKPASGAHGMVFVGNDLICTGDNSLMKLRDTDGDGVADGEPEIWAKLKSSEHGANGVVQGPDGWIYVACGNDAGVTAAHATLPTSPVKKPEAGAILRFSPDGKHSEIFAHGFRNIYDLDFNAFGQLFTVDSDGERDHHLPWYAPTRLFDVAEGMHHGWVLQGHMRSWNRPAYFPDVAPRYAEIGRGSPTGVVVYRHTQFPREYQGKVFSACWTLGKIYFVDQEDSVRAEKGFPSTFVETSGETGFAPVDLAIGTEGDMYIAVGGRGTRGSVFRVRYKQDKGPASGPPIVEQSLEQRVENILDVPQPLAAWSRSSWTVPAKKIGRPQFVLAVTNPRLHHLQRKRAVEIITELFGGFTPQEAELCKDADDAEVTSKAVWSLRRTHSDLETATQLVKLANEFEAEEEVWQGIANLAGTDLAIDRELLRAEPQYVLDLHERRKRSAVLRADAALRTPVEEEPEDISKDDLWRLHFRGELKSKHFSIAATAFLDAAAPEDRMDCLRLMELAMGDINVQPMAQDVYAGYALNASAADLQQVADKFGEKLASQFPSFNHELNLELARLLAMIHVKDPALLDRLSDAFSTPRTSYEYPYKTDNLHYLICLSRLPGVRRPVVTRRTALGLLDVFPHYGSLSRNWPTRLGEALDELYRQDPSLAGEIASDHRLKPAKQALLVSHMQGESRLKGIQALVKSLSDRKEDEFRCSNEVVLLVTELPLEERVPVLRHLWTEIALRDSILVALAKQPAEDDREKFLDGLSSVQPNVVEAAAGALTKLGGDGKEAELATGFTALRQNCLATENKTTREALAELLNTWTGQDFEIEEPKEQRKLLAAYKPWFDWLEKEHPAIAKKVAGFGDVTAEQWLARLKKVDWTMGEEKRGLTVFQKKACHKCHAGNSPLGPNLAGAAKRFSREDLFGSILDPHKEVAPPYQTTQIATSSGKVYSGLIVYESPDGTLVQTTPDTTIRIAGDEILSMKKGRISLMPSGLLNDTSDLDLADLYAYLKTVKNVK